MKDECSVHTSVFYTKVNSFLITFAFILNIETPNNYRTADKYFSYCCR